MVNPISNTNWKEMFHNALLILESRVLGDYNKEIIMIVEKEDKQTLITIPEKPMVKLEGD